MVFRKIESRIINGDNELPAVMFDGMQLAQSPI
jgi:hypothetical protein